LCPEGLAWLPDGHVSDWAINVLVDGEGALLPVEAVSHVDTCEHCIERLATMATMAFALGEELALVAERQELRKAPFPLASFGAAAGLAVSFALYSWTTQGTAIADLPHQILAIVRGLRLVGPVAAQQLGSGLATLLGTVALVAVVLGMVVARKHAFIRPESSS
jgi:hypothetical protein